MAWNLRLNHPKILRTSLSLQGEPANIGKGLSRPDLCTRGSGDRFGIPETSRERIGDWGGPETVSCHVGLMPRGRETDRQREREVY